MKQLIRRAAGRLGYDVVRRAAARQADLPPDVDGDTAATVAAVRGLTLTTTDRVIALCEAVRHVVRAGVPGALVECGVWRGGSSLAMVRTLLDLGVTDRDVFMFDTFERMPEPGPEDVDLQGTSAATYHRILEEGGDYDRATYDYLPYGEVQAVLSGTGYPPEHLHFVRGLVEDTLPEHAPERAALVRLDTDYYRSTRHELEHLYPRLSTGGVLLIDDYGHWLGCRQAVDEYLAQLAAEGTHLLLHRIDYSARLAVVPPVGSRRPPVGAPRPPVGARQTTGEGRESAVEGRGSALPDGRRAGATLG